MKKNRKIILFVSIFMLFLCASFFVYKHFAPESYSRINSNTPKWDGTLGYEFGGGNGTNIYTHHKRIDWYTRSKFVVEIPQITIGTRCDKVGCAIITTW